MRLKDKVAIITGAGGAQGRTATIMFCQEGAKVVAVDWDQKNVEETVRIAKEMGGDAVAYLCDISKEEQVKNMVKFAVDTYGKLNVLYNNAAINTAEGPCTEVDEQILNLNLDVNLKGHFFCCKHAIPEMIKGSGGSIINIATGPPFTYTTGERSFADVYLMAKAGLRALSRSIAGTFASKNIRSNVIGPGLILAGGHEEIKKNPQAVELIRHAIGPMNRIGMPEDIVYCAIWLASDESSYCTGSDITIDGGASVTRGATFNGGALPLLSAKLRW
jgi:NAD(P)-dependent dehydrogenase (short-subunit alcohol dehydrogenase family)